MQTYNVLCDNGSQTYNVLCDTNKDGHVIILTLKFMTKHVFGHETKTNTFYFNRN